MHHDLHNGLGVTNPEAICVPHPQDAASDVAGGRTSHAARAWYHMRRDHDRTSTRSLQHNRACPAASALALLKQQRSNANSSCPRPCGAAGTEPPNWSAPLQDWKATKEYLNQRGTKIRVFRVRFRAPFLPPFFPHFPPSFPLRALFTPPPLLPSSPPPSSPLFWLPKKSDLGTPLIWVLFSVLQTGLTYFQRTLCMKTQMTQGQLDGWQGGGHTNLCGWLAP